MVHESPATPAEIEPFEAPLDWWPGAVAGFLASLVMGIAIAAVDLPTLRTAIAGLYGLSGSLVVGWIAHLVHGTLFGMAFAWILSDPGLHGLAGWRWKTALAGVVYGTVLAVAGAGIIMPVWLGLVGFPTPPEIPHITIPMLAWHVIYGLVLGAGFHALETG